MTETRETTLSAGDGRRVHAFLALPSGVGPHPGVIVLHEIFGLNSDMRRIARRFADSGYAALAPDLFGGRGPKAICIARTMLSIRSGRGTAYDDVDAARRYLESLAEVDGTRLGIVGFCMGGGFALLAALQGPFRVAAPFYGEVPKNAKSLEGICPVVGGYGSRDKIFAAQGERLKRHLEMLQVPHDVVIYPHAGHSYMSQASPTLVRRIGAKGPMKAGYDATAAEDSWRRMLAFFGRYLVIAKA
jgi:carboxymethylenebutenolidase